LLRLSDGVVTVTAPACGVILGTFRGGLGVISDVAEANRRFPVEEDDDDGDDGGGVMDDGDAVVAFMIMVGFVMSDVVALLAENAKNEILNDGNGVYEMNRNMMRLSTPCPRPPREKNTDDERHHVRSRSRFERTRQRLMKSIIFCHGHDFVPQ
jgi:hypothetical protein